MGGDVATIAPGQTSHSIAVCTSGKKALSGGFTSTGALETQYDVPYGNAGVAWYVAAKNVGGQTVTMTGYVVCANG